ncbi:hypothetical protein CH063_09015 [Colletotrichum higginsianum]|uniref:Uncharacterized protein n=1 Tax=Colletotrichum higginsianum (strain IMI 349063) TaxID=759273 RepID=H1VC10_COLHI|nr:hypothetical protein CH063_09015 [Colletotrichum higginsianum]
MCRLGPAVQTLPFPNLPSILMQTTRVEYSSSLASYQVRRWVSPKHMSVPPRERKRLIIVRPSSQNVARGDMDPSVADREEMPASTRLESEVVPVEPSGCCRPQLLTPSFHRSNFSSPSVSTAWIYCTQILNGHRRS